MQAMKKILADTVKRMKEQEEEAKANKEALKEARTKRQKAGKESEQAQANLMELTKEGNAPRQILSSHEHQQQEESNTGGGPSGTPSEMNKSLDGITFPTNDEGGPSRTLMTPQDLIPDTNAEMKDVGNKRGREESGEEQVQAKRGSTPVHGELQDANKDTTTKKDQTTDEQKDAQMEEDL